MDARFGHVLLVFTLCLASTGATDEQQVIETIVMQHERVARWSELTATAPVFGRDVKIEIHKSESDALAGIVVSPAPFSVELTEKELSAYPAVLMRTFRATYIGDSENESSWTLSLTFNFGEPNNEGPHGLVAGKIETYNDYFDAVTFTIQGNRVVSVFVTPAGEY